MHTSLSLSSTSALATPQAKVAKIRANDLYWVQSLFVVLIVILKILAFASIVLWPWKSAE